MDRSAGLTTEPVSHLRAWNDLLTGLPRAHILQAWEWGEFKSRYGWQAQRLVLSDAGTPRAAAQVLRRNLPRTRLGILYVPRGPALDYADPDLFGRVLSTLEYGARRQGAILITLDPDVERDSPAAALFRARGWRPSAEQIQFRSTILLDLDRPEEEILAAMKPKWRYNIRLAAKRGVRVEPGTISDLPAFYRMYAETSARDGFLIRLFPYYQALWESFLNAGLAHLLLARVEGETVAGLLLFRFARRAWYFYGASTARNRELMPNHLLQWEAIRWARAAGCVEYDFWGAPDTLNESDPLFGVYRFKEGFGGRFVQTAGAHDYVVNPSLYFLYARVRPWYLDRLRRRHPTPLAEN